MKFAPPFARFAGWLGLSGPADEAIAVPAAARPAAPPVGTLLSGRYQLMSQLGQGGGSCVYRATDRFLDVDVAVKVLLLDGMFSTGDGRGLAASLRSEARASLRLTHPNIVRVFTYEKDGDWEFLVMEFIDGEDLAHRRSHFEGRRLPMEEVLNVGIACCDALAYAHDHGFIHNDIKPGNVLIDTDGNIKVIDFGLASLAEREAREEVGAGSPVYMAPERIRGESGDGRSDLYSLGATLYTLAAGRPPFGKDARAAMRGHLKGNLPVIEGVPAELDGILRRAMAKRADDRFAHAAEMRDALAYLLDHESEPPEVHVSDGSTPIPIRQPLGGGTPPPVDPRGRAVRPPATAPEPAFAAPQGASSAGPWKSSPAQGTSAAGPWKAPASFSSAGPAPVRPEPAAPAPVVVEAPVIRVPPGMIRMSARSVEVRGLRVDVPAYHLDPTPVTNDAYARFVAEKGEPPPSHWLHRKPPPGKGDHPVVGVTLDQARRYAAWAGKRLPTEAEWMAAARGVESRPFPWGDTCQASHCQCPKASPDDTAPVHAHRSGATSEGVLDLLGNVWEWVEPDARLPAPEAGRGVALGGSFKHVCKVAGEVPRSEIDAMKSYVYLGFRCAFGGGAA